MAGSVQGHCRRGFLHACHRERWWDQPSFSVGASEVHQTQRGASLTTGQPYPNPPPCLWENAHAGFEYCKCHSRTQICQYPIVSLHLFQDGAACGPTLMYLPSGSTEARAPQHIKAQVTHHLEARIAGYLLRASSVHSWLTEVGGVSCSLRGEHPSWATRTPKGVC